MTTRHLSKRVHAFRVANARGITHLAQWHHSRKLQTPGGGTLCSFTSCVKRAGMPGWWVMQPYFCYGGPKPITYRRLPRLLELRLRVAIARSMVRDAKESILRQAQSALWSVLRLAEKLSPAYQLREYRARKEWQAFLRGEFLP